MTWLIITLSYALAILLGAILHALLMQSHGMHAVPGGPLPEPEPEPEPVHPRFGPLLGDTPPEGILVDTPAGPAVVGTGGFAPIVQTDDQPPWDIETGSFPVVADQDAEQERASYVREHLPECTATPEVLERVRDGLRGEHPYPAASHANGWL